MADGRDETSPQTLSRGDGSLRLQLLTDLRRRLELGAFDDGFPGELALVEEYQVSRHTVREALRVLREEGVLVAARGRAPRLVGPAPDRTTSRPPRPGKEPLMTSTDPIAQVDPRTASDLATGGAVLLDVREPEEWRVGHIGDAVHMPLSDLQPDSVPRDRVVVAVCRSSNRSGKAAVQLAAAGVDVRNMSGDLPITTDDGAPGTVG